MARDRARRGRRVVPAAIAVAAVAAEAAVLRRRGYRMAGDVVVRCRGGHLFTTIWVLGVSVKAVRLGPWRIQRCPVGRHWALVTPASVSELTEEERRAASEARDIRIP